MTAVQTPPGEQVAPRPTAPSTDGTSPARQPNAAHDAERSPTGKRGDGALKLACFLAAIAGIGLITGAVLGVAVDTAGVTTAGTIAAISGGGVFAVGWVTYLGNWYRKRTMPVEEEAPSPSKEKPKPSPAKKKPSPSKR